MSNAGKGDKSPAKVRGLALKLAHYEITVACTPEGEALLKQSEVLVNQKFAEIEATGKIVGADRIALLAALNLTHELLHAQALSLQAATQAANPNLTPLITQLSAQLGEALALPHDELDTSTDFVAIDNKQPKLF